MKATTIQLAAALTLTFGIAACVPSALAPAPAPAPVARPAPAPAVAQRPVTQAPLSDNWMDAPVTPGTWQYQNSAGGPQVVFIGSQGRGEFLMTCDRSRRQIDFWRAGQSPVTRVMTIRTETATRSFEVVQAEDTIPYLTTGIAGGDPLLDAMAISKGQFAVEVDGLPALYLPSWAEVSRVIEDCR